MLLSNLEYIPLRILRKFVFKESFLIKFGRFIPYYLTNRNQIDPALIINQYEEYLPARTPCNTILEIGVGATNSSGYAMIAHQWAEQVYLLEPYVSFYPACDTDLLNQLASKTQLTASAIKEKVFRFQDIQKIENQSVDLILSSSVLEHVLTPATLFRELKRILKTDGMMLHLVDYRDHFFKYPYHFLQFSKKTWHKYLDPGDLPGWRLQTHVDLFQKIGLSVDIVFQQQEKSHFEKIKPYISIDYNKQDPLLSVSFAALLVKHHHGDLSE